MKLSDFDFELPKELIANYPANPRDSSRLLVVDSLEEKIFRDLPSLLQEGDLLVFNNSKVIPARLFVEKNGSKIEIFLHKKLDGKSRQPAASGGAPSEERSDARGANKTIWQAFAKPGKKLKVGEKYTVIPANAGIQKNQTGWTPACAGVTVLEKLPSGEIIVELENEEEVFKKGHIPLPPYINRADEESDKTNYQTVYAKDAGSVAAPTAGLHFTPELLEKIPNKAFVTLHVGAGTFLPVKTKNLAEHKMHSEWYEVPPETEEKIKAAKRVIAVGTTSLRTLEASGGKAGCSDTDIFITPGYNFKVVDGLITNFHLPKSTLFMLTCALAGTEKMRAAYAHAIAQKFKFFSYGDACFISP